MSRTCSSGTIKKNRLFAKEIPALIANLLLIDQAEDADLVLAWAFENLETPLRKAFANSEAICDFDSGNRTRRPAHDFPVVP